MDMAPVTTGMVRVVCWIFFFSSRRRHTRYIGDWSSDVCSSDLAKWPPRIRVAEPEIADAGVRLQLIGDVLEYAVATSRPVGPPIELHVAKCAPPDARSEERRVGKEGRCR